MTKIRTLEWVFYKATNRWVAHGYLPEGQKFWYITGKPFFAPTGEVFARFEIGSLIPGCGLSVDGVEIAMTLEAAYKRCQELHDNLPDTCRCSICRSRWQHLQEPMPEIDPAFVDEFKQLPSDSAG